MMDVIVFIFNPWLQIKPGLCSACCCFKSQPQPHVAETSSAAPGDRERVSHIETNLCLSSLSPPRWRCQGLGADRRQFCRKSVRYRARPRRTSVSHGTGVRGEGGRSRGLPARWALSRPWDPPTLNPEAWDRQDYESHPAWEPA